MARLAQALIRRLAAALDAPLSWRDPVQPADAIVILGAPLLPDGGLSAVLDERVRAGVALWQLGAAPLVCVTGGGPHGRIEADAMARRVLELGVLATALRVERRATSTEDNARYTAELLAGEGCQTVWVVSQPFHLRRALYLFRKHGFTALAWHAEHSLQYREPDRALRWLGREYAALVGLAMVETLGALRRLPGRRRT